jgi:hypothetical protein
MEKQINEYILENFIQGQRVAYDERFGDAMCVTDSGITKINTID